MFSILVDQEFFFDFALSLYPPARVDKLRVDNIDHRSAKIKSRARSIGKPHIITTLIQRSRISTRTIRYFNCLISRSTLRQVYTGLFYMIK